MGSLSTVFILISLALQGFCCLVNLEFANVTISQGILSGVKKTAVLGNEYYSFKGIPYAAPPVGDLRFKSPQAAPSWDGVRDARNHGSTCPQLDFIGNAYTPGDEDCLYLNVYTPDLAPTTPIPVLIVIHGGGNMFGSGNTDVYGPDFLVGDLVVVTFNYRLGVLGFLSTEDSAAPGNFGLKDQVAAFEWVKDNIANFGGDPNSVTLLGSTAGGAAIGNHLVSAKSKGLFQRVIPMSGGPTGDSYVSFEPRRRAFQLGKSLGYEAQNTTDLIEFLRTATTEQLTNHNVTYGTIVSSEETTLISFKMMPFAGAVVESADSDESFITVHPLEAIANGAVNSADIMFSYNSEETSVVADQYDETYIAEYARYPELFVPSQILSYVTPGKTLELADKIIDFYFGNKSITVDNMRNFINYANNVSISYNIHRYYRKWPSTAGNLYSFVYSANSSRNVYGQIGAPYGIIGPAHSDDNFSVFNAESQKMSLVVDSKEYYIIKNLTSAIINFAQYGDPSPDGSLVSSWPQYTDNYAYINFGDEVTLDYGADADDVTFWESIYNDAGIAF